MIERHKKARSALITFQCMGLELNAEQLVLRIILTLVDNTKEVRIRSLTTELGTTFEVTVAQTDVERCPKTARSRNR
jgi:hypothetical protein